MFLYVLQEGPRCAKNTRFVDLRIYEYARMRVCAYARVLKIRDLWIYESTNLRICAYARMNARMRV